MQNTEIEKAIPWNPWHGCKKVSPGCKNCFVFKMDKRYGRDTTIITKGKTTYELKDKDCPPNSLVKLCFSSDFFIEEADEWREGCWDFIRRRKDCIFVTTTKRPERIKECLPPDWGEGWEHFHLSISIENQEMADKRLPYFLDAPLAHREVFCSPLIAPISLGKYLDTGLIKCVNVGGEMAPTADVRPIRYEWVEALYLEAKERNIEFYFHQCGSMFLKDGLNIGKWNLNEQIKRAEEIQHELEETYRLIPICRGVKMLIDFNSIKEITIPGMNNGTGEMTAKMFMDNGGKIISCKIHTGGSIGTHKHETSDDINYVISGSGKAICDGKEEALKAGCCHICKKGSEHSIINTGDDDLVLLTVVVER